MMLDSLVGNEYAQALYDHPLIKGLRKPKRLPSYVNPEDLRRCVDRGRGP